MMGTTPRDPWVVLAMRTPARIAIGRTGASLPTREVLSFALAHAQARDAVHARLDLAALGSSLHARGLATIEIASEARDRAVYLRRPDLGRCLERASRQRLGAAGDGTHCDMVLMIGDGLSATAVTAHALPLLDAALPLLRGLNLELGPIVLAQGARVALGDEVAALLHAKLVVVLIGERPGLSAPDSLGVYLTYDPHPGRTDAERNCISNIRIGGLEPGAAARNLAWLVEAALTRQATGISLKDESDAQTTIADASVNATLAVSDRSLE